MLFPWRPWPTIKAKACSIRNDQPFVPYFNMSDGRCRTPSISLSQQARCLSSKAWASCCHNRLCRRRQACIRWNYLVQCCRCVVARNARGRPQPITIEENAAVALLPSTTCRALLARPIVPERSIEKTGMIEDAVNDELGVIPPTRSIVMVHSLPSSAIHRRHILDVIVPQAGPRLGA